MRWNDPDSDGWGDPEDLGCESAGKLHEGWVWSDKYGWSSAVMYELPARITCYPSVTGDKALKDEG